MQALKEKRGRQDNRTVLASREIFVYFGFRIYSSHEKRQMFDMLKRLDEDETESFEEESLEERLASLDIGTISYKSIKYMSII